MSVSRREVLQAGAGLGVAATVGGCTTFASRYAAAPLPAELPPPKLAHSPAFRLLNRAAFGPVPGQVAEVEASGLSTFLDAQLKPGGDENPALMIALQGIMPLRMDATELRDEPEHEVLRGLQQAAILRAVYGRWQLQERLVDFWSNHFNIYGRKGLAAYRKATDETKVIRPHVFGSFGEMVKASAQSPAMLAYLDNQLNTSAGPNENYARELMELHTLGVGGGYTQRDVEEVARCFTGWTYETRYLKPRGKFRFDETRHDFGEKKVLGQRIPAGGGMEDGLRVIEILAAHTSAAKFVTRKLCKYFVGTDDGPAQRAAERAYQDSKGDLRAVTAAIVKSPEMLEGAPIVKRPFDYVVSALRGLGATTDGSRGVQGHLQSMGQPLYQWPMPDGYPDGAEAWTGSLLARWNFAAALASGAVGGTTIPLAALIQRGGGDAATVAANLLLGSPDSQVPRLEMPADAFAATLATPEFQWR